MRRAAAATAAVALLLAGCSGGQAPTPSQPTGSTPTPAASTPTPQPSESTAVPGEPSTPPAGPTPSATSAPPGSSEAPIPDDAASAPPWLTGPSDRAASAVGQEITGVRTGLHDGYDRVVLDLTGSDPELGWFAGFTDEAIADPSGRPLDVDGDAFLQLGVTGIDWITPSPERYSGDPVRDDALEVVREVVFGGLFEGQQQILIGLDAQTAYRVFALSAPARIVVDIRHG